MRSVLALTTIYAAIAIYQLATAENVPHGPPLPTSVRVANGAMPASEPRVFMPMVFRAAHTTDFSPARTPAATATASATSIAEPTLASPTATPSPTPVEPTSTATPPDATSTVPSPTAEPTSETTPTATITPIATATTSATPQPKVIFSDDFSNPASGWDTGEDIYYRAGYSSGEYEIFIKPEDTLHFEYAPRTRCGACAVEVTGRFVANRQADEGIFIRTVDGLGEFWIIVVGNDSLVTIFRHNRDDTWKQLFRRPGWAHANRGTLPNRLRVERQGASVKFYTNGELVTEVEDRLLEGEIAVGVVVQTGLASSLAARFDDFLVTELPSSP